MSRRDEMHARAAAMSVSELAEHAKGHADDEMTWIAIHQLQKRGGAPEFQAALALSRSSQQSERAAAAHILAQLGYSTGHCASDCVDVLMGLLADQDPAVIAAAATALGHRSDTRPIEYLLALAKHHDEEIRRGVVHGLSNKDDPRAINALISLSRDPIAGIRDWATFGLAQQTETDTPEIREALWQRATDEDEDTRAEALCGLILRRDPRGRELMLTLLDGTGNNLQTCCFDAIAEAEDVDFLPKLEALRQRLEADDINSGWLRSLEHTIERLRELGPATRMA